MSNKTKVTCAVADKYGIDNDIQTSTHSTNFKHNTKNQTDDGSTPSTLPGHTTDVTAQLIATNVTRTYNHTYMTNRITTCGTHHNININTSNINTNYKLNNNTMNATPTRINRVATTTVTSYSYSNNLKVYGTSASPGAGELVVVRVAEIIYSISIIHQHIIVKLQVNYNIRDILKHAKKAELARLCVVCLCFLVKKKTT